MIIEIDLDKVKSAKSEVDNLVKRANLSPE